MVKRAVALLIINSAILFPHSVFAAYVQSGVFIVNNNDAMIKCPQVCTSPSDWTGSWWTTTGGVSVCECFVGWQYCPVVAGPPFEPGCAFPP